jgi:hypothetical protein
MKLFPRGSRVVQPQYGAGTVTTSDERYTVIEFDLHGSRRFVTDMVALSASEVPAPDKPARARRRKASTAAS